MPDIKFQPHTKEDPFIQSVQEAFFAATAQRLGDDEADLVDRAICSLKIFDDWSENESLMKTRAAHLFDEKLISDLDAMIFPTKLLFLRDIIENESIDGFLHSPTVFMSSPLAHFLFPEYEILIVVDHGKLISANPTGRLRLIGGMLISNGGSVCLPHDAIRLIRLRSRGHRRDQETYDIVTSIVKGCQGTLSKQAVSQIDKGVFQIDEDQRNLNPGQRVTRKGDKATGNIERITPGEEGTVAVHMDDGSEEEVKQVDFDARYVTASQSYPIDVGGHRVNLNENQIILMLKEKISRSQAIRRLFTQFDVSLDRIGSVPIHFDEMSGKYAETDAESIRLNRDLLSEPDFVSRFFFVVVHELVHWLTRVKEDQGYFHDPEEVLGFVAAIAYELESGGDMETAKKKIYPKIQWHFHSERDAEQFFHHAMEKAQGLLE
jgi:hypothetical protein